jgi:hypothetical protein
MNFHTQDDAEGVGWDLLDQSPVGIEFIIKQIKT